MQRTMRSDMRPEMGAAHGIGGGKQVYGDGSWQLSIFVTDLQVERSLRVRGDLHIGGVMIKLVDCLDIQCQRWNVQRSGPQTSRGTFTLQTSGSRTLETELSGGDDEEEAPAPHQGGKHRGQAGHHHLHRTERNL